MRLRQLGKSGLLVSELALGGGGLTMKRPGAAEQGSATVQAALTAGINFMVTADFYGMGDSETLVGRATQGRRDQVCLGVKFGLMLSPSNAWLGLAGRPQAVKNFASYSLRRLGLSVLDQAFAPGAIRGDRYPALVTRYAAH